MKAATQTPMPANTPAPAGAIDFQTEPARYRHWQLSIEGNVATLGMNVTETATLKPGYELKLNSYDLGVDIELYDAIQRLRFEHPEVGAVVVKSLKDRVFCAGANIRMLGKSTHAHKVNFCKFTNETRNGIEDATQYSGQTYLCAVRGSCAGGGYELALACDRIIMVDDGATAVSLPETPLLAVLPGTGGLTRLIDKRHVRRDHADWFCTIEEGVRGQRAVEWRLVDEVVPASSFEQVVRERALAAAATSDRPRAATGIALLPVSREFGDHHLRYPHVSIEIDRGQRVATITVLGPKTAAPATLAAIVEAGVEFWPLALARELDDAILHLRFNEEEIGTWLFKTEGDADLVAQYDALLEANAGNWFVRETTLYLKRVLKRLDVTARTLLAAIEPGSCYTGTLLEIALAADQSFMLDGERPQDPRPAPAVRLTAMNFGAYVMVNGITRLTSRFLHDPTLVDSLKTSIGKPLDAAAARGAGLVTFTPDDIDWEDELRIVIEARASFSPDALTGMEANLRFGGPETMESKIFGRLSAWQNWIFQRPNAVGEKGALVLYGSGQRPDYHKRRV